MSENFTYHAQTWKSLFDTALPLNLDLLVKGKNLSTQKPRFLKQVKSSASTPILHLKEQGLDLEEPTLAELRQHILPWKKERSSV